MTSLHKGTAAIALLMLCAGALAQKPVVYPAKGQSPAQQQKDEGQCYSWSKSSTGVDPAKLAAQPPAQEQGPAVGGGERAKGAVRGAVGGAAIGAITGDSGKGAGTGAVVGTMAGGRQARQNQAAKNQQSKAQHNEQLNTYHRAFGACMEGRGYTIR
jgi:hypothetical protein